MSFQSNRVYFIRRIKVRIKKLFAILTKDKEIIDPLEPKVLLLCRKLLQDSNSIIHRCPMSGNRFICNDYKSIYVVIENYRIKIASNSYQDIEISQYGHRAICQIFDSKLSDKSEYIFNQFKRAKERNFDKTLLSY